MPSHITSLKTLNWRSIGWQGRYHNCQCWTTPAPYKGTKRGHEHQYACKQCLIKAGIRKR